MDKLEKIRLIFIEFEKIRSENPEMKRMYALKLAASKVNLGEEKEYGKHGKKVKDLLGHHKHKDWTY